MPSPPVDRPPSQTPPPSPSSPFEPCPPVNVRIPYSTLLTFADFVILPSLFTHSVPTYTDVLLTCLYTVFSNGLSFIHLSVPYRSYSYLCLSYYRYRYRTYTIVDIIDPFLSCSISSFVHTFSTFSGVHLTFIHLSISIRTYVYLIT